VDFPIATMFLRINARKKSMVAQSTGDLKTKGLVVRMGPLCTDALLDGADHGRVFQTRTPIFLAYDAPGFITGRMLAIDRGIPASGVKQ
jgi:hypothetical protein